jgi:hypothetical protein
MEPPHAHAMANPIDRRVVDQIRRYRRERGVRRLRRDLRDPLDRHRWSRWQSVAATEHSEEQAHPHPPDVNRLVGFPLAA